MSAPPPLADSAGQPWAGRHFEPNANAEDDGTAPAGLLAALAGFRSGESGQEAVVEAFRRCRLLIPLMAELGEEGVDERGRRIDKRQELSIVTVAGPDGRRVLPVFSSVTTMAAWNALARPVPAEGLRVALAAASEGTDLVVLDPTSETEFALRRPALWALAQEREWIPSHLAPEVAAEFERSVAEEPAVVSIGLAPGDPEARLLGPELRVELSLITGLGEEQLSALLERLSSRWSSSEVVAERVDSLEIALLAAG